MVVISSRPLQTRPFPSAWPRLFFSPPVGGVCVPPFIPSKEVYPCPPSSFISDKPLPLFLLSSPPYAFSSSSLFPPPLPLHPPLPPPRIPFALTLERNRRPLFKSEITVPPYQRLPEILSSPATKLGPPFTLLRGHFFFLSPLPGGAFFTAEYPFHRQSDFPLLFSLHF